MILLVPIFFIILLFALYISKPKNTREIILKTFLITFFLIGLSTEVLSLFKSITYQGILYSWTLFIAAALILLVIANIRNPKLVFRSSTHDTSVLFRIISLSILLIISSITLFIALKSPPNNFDSMTYHMARIPHWIQNQSIAYFPTSIPRQNYSLPLAEFGILQLQILSKGDQYANLIQWISFILSIIATSLIAKDLKISARGQWMTALLSATIPMVILQSSSTQNDLVVGIFCLCFAYFLSKTIKSTTWENVIFTGLSLGLALATKGTAYIFCAAIGLGIGGLALFNHKWSEGKKLLTRFLFIITLALILNGGIYIRNWNLYNNPIITSNERTIVDEVSPGILISNLIRNGSIHLASPFSSVNNLVNNSVTSLLGSQIDNPASTFQKSHFDISFSINEDEAGNAIHFILTTVSILLIPFLKTEHKQEQRQYILVILLCILFFSLAFKWQPWGGRLQTPIFLMGCVVIGFVFDHLFRKDNLPIIIFLLLLIISTPYLLLNFSRPLLPLWEDDSVFYDTELERRIYSRIDQNLENYPALSQKLSSAFSILYEGRSVVLTNRDELIFLGNFEPYYWYNAACHYVRNDPSQDIGLIMDNNQWEYPLWVLIGQHASSGPRNLYHINVDNISGTISNNNSPEPGLILVTKSEYKDIIDLSIYSQVYSSTSIQIFKLNE